jgi:hypothetical protein
MATLTEARKPVRFSPGFLAWMAFIGVLITIGLVSAIYVFINGLVVTNMYNTVPWGLWITIDLSAIALGPLLASLGVLERPFGAVGNHLVHHDLFDHHDHGIFTGHHGE